MSFFTFIKKILAETMFVEWWEIFIYIAYTKIPNLEYMKKLHSGISKNDFSETSAVFVSYMSIDLDYLPQNKSSNDWNRW